MNNVTENPAKEPFVFPEPTLSDQEFAELMEYIQRRKDDSEYVAYLQRGRVASEEYRREVNEQERRWLDSEPAGTGTAAASVMLN